MQGRILKVIADLQAAPTTPHGDTIKPLIGNLAGLWGYRIGDNRLIYWPDQQRARITLIFFSARGDIYDDAPETTALLRGPEH